MSIGQRVSWLLVVRQMTQAEAAAQMGLSQSAISNITSSASRKPSASTLLRMAEVLMCSPKFILYGQGHPFAESPPDDNREAELLAIFRRLDERQQDMALVFAKLLIPTTKNLGPGSPTRTEPTRRFPHPTLVPKRKKEEPRKSEAPPAITD